MARFAKLRKMMQAPDNRAASLKGSAKSKSPKSTRDQDWEQDTVGHATI